MKSIVPFTKEITFPTKIAEICSISLEHELNINASEIEGKFIVTGEYKSHEVSVNKEPFEYKLPFTLEVTENIIKDTIDFEITDFTYEIVHDSTLKVNIEFCVTASEKEEEEKEVEEVEEAEVEEISKEQEEIRESVMEEIHDMFLEEEKEEEQETPIEERIDPNSETIILNSINEKENEFASYNIHVVGNNDSIESICAMYNTDEKTLKEYNNIENIQIGDKIIIPCIDE